MFIFMVAYEYEVPQQHKKPHHVYFLDSIGQLIGDPLLVEQGESVPPPAYQPPPGQIFLYWSRNTANVTEDIYCVALTQPKAYLDYYCVTYYDDAGLVMDMQAVLADETTLLPDFSPAEGYRLAGWDICFDDAEDIFVPAGKTPPYITQDCRVHARCEPAACRLFAVDMREEKPKLLPLGSYGYGALISQEDLVCLHLRSKQYLYPFRFTMYSDTVLALTQQGVRAFTMDMQPLEMNAVRLVSGPGVESTQFECAAISHSELLQKEA